METPFTQHHWLDENEKPAGGVSFGPGFTISWQNGPLGAVGDDDRREPNGAFVETMIKAIIGRIKFYELAGFGCEENRAALKALHDALDFLNERTARRTEAGVEGSHEKAPGDDAAG